MTNKEAIKYLQQLYPNGGHCWLDEQRIEAIGMAIQALQEEPVSDIEAYQSRWGKSIGFIDESTSEEIGDYDHKAVMESLCPQLKEEPTIPDIVDEHFWKMLGEEPVSEDLGEYINELSKQFPEVSFAKLSRIAVRVAKWQKEHLWMSADGDDLPECNREVIALEDDRFCGYKVVFAHRPNPNGWDGKSLSTGKVEHYTPKTYDKGGWNIPNIKYFLDVELPKEIEL